MRMFKRYFKIYCLLAKQNIKTKLEFRTDFIISSFGIIITNLAGIFTFFLIFNSITNIKGINYYEMLFIYSFFLIAISPQQIFFDNIWNMWSHLINGTFIKYYLRPIDNMFYYMSEAIDIKGISQFLLGIIMLIYSAINMEYRFTIGSIILLIILLISSSVIMISLMTIAAATGFWILDPFEIISLVFKGKDFAKYPMTIYNGAVKFIFTFIIPFGFLAYYPSMIFIDNNICLVGISTPIIAVISFIITRYVWRAGLKVYNPTGS